MPLSGAQRTKLYSSWQNARCRFVSFPAYEVVSTGSFADGVYTFFDMVNVHPRHSWVTNNAAIVLDGNDSIARGGAPATGHVWTLISGGGALVDNLDGTATYTAPASGSSPAIIRLRTDGNVDNNYAYVAYGGQSLNIGAVTGFSADIGSGGWTLTLQAYGDCSGLERQKGILLVVDDYWNGSEDTFGGYKWAHGVFYGYVDRVRKVHQSSGQTYLEVTMTSPSALLNRGQVCDLLFVQADTADDNIVIADFMAIDAVWWILTESGYNLRHNVYVSADANSVANLKVSKGPYFEVLQDIAARTLYLSYDSKLGDLYVVGDPDVRYLNYFVGLDAEFSLGNDIVEYVEFEWEDICNPAGDPPDPTDPTYESVLLTAIESSLDELSSEYPSSVATSGGKRAELGGLICETQATLDAWAERYWYKIQPEIKGACGMFLMHHVDLYSFLTWSITIRAADLSNTGVGEPVTGVVYVTGIDYQIDPGMGTWRGSIQFVSQGRQS